VRVVEIDSGGVRGVEDGGALAFLGIPYAAPPVGLRRFMPPEPPQAWSGVRDASSFGPAAAQVPKRGSLDDVGELSEDCLYLNVWTPSCDERRRPVMFWIHGGGLRGGGASEASSYGSALAARHDVVVVTVGYRLGVFGGFVWLSQLDDDRLSRSANVGLLDQLAALRWVNANVEKFGGDPGCVTIFGQSSGGQSVAMLMSMPESIGLLHRAIAQSPAQPRALEPDTARFLLDRYLAHLGARGVEAAGIYTAPSQELVAAVSDLKKETDWGVIGHPIHPILDGAVLRRQPLDAIGAGQAADIPLLAGWNRDELVLNFGPDVPRLTSEALAPELARPLPDPTVASRMAEAYGAEALAGLQPSPPAPWTMFNGDRMVRIGAERLLDAQSAHQGRTYAYMLAWDPPSARGSLHCMEIPLVFDTTGRSAWGRLIGDGPTVEPMTARIQAAWVAFARTGDPNVPLLPAWPRYETPYRATMLLGDAPVVGADVWPAQRAAWNGVDL